MAVRARKIKWSPLALQSMVLALTTISADSAQGAEEVEKAIMGRIETAAVRPERYPVDKFKGKKSDQFRAFETHSFRVSYRYTRSEIRILRVRHVRQAPKLY
jgi:plasmid stabilization system protein ParE